jgi:hypothetical protein
MAVLEFWRHRLPLAPSLNDLIKLRDYRSYRSPCKTLKSGNYTVSTTDFELQSMDDDIHLSSTVQVNRVVEPYPVWGPSVGPTASGTDSFSSGLSLPLPPPGTTWARHRSGYTVDTSPSVPSSSFSSIYRSFRLSSISPTSARRSSPPALKRMSAKLSHRPRPL